MFAMSHKGSSETMLSHSLDVNEPRSILFNSPIGDRTHFPGASQSADTANWTPGTEAKTVLRSLQMQYKVASGLVAQTYQFDRSCTNLAWCSFPGGP